MRLKVRALTIGILGLALFAAACGGSGPATPGSNAGSSGNGLALQGAGSSFVNPLMSKWIAEYNKKDPNVKIDYQSIGSGAGIKQITDKTVDFGATDAFLTDEQLKAVPKEILHIPLAMGAVVVTYNLPDVKQAFKLDGPTIAGIFLGDIKKWNDPKIAALNPGVNLPATDIAIAHRSDGSGTTAIFTDYLSKVNPDWKSKVGSSTSVNWPTGFGGKGNEGVAGFVKQTPGAVGYVELIYAIQNKLPYASVKNPAGDFVEPSLDAVTAAAAGAVKNIPEDLRVTLTNVEGQGAYPISGWTYALVYRDQDNEAKGKALADFLWWCLNDGQHNEKDLQYAPLPADVLAKTQAKIKSMNYNGKPFVS